MTDKEPKSIAPGYYTKETLPPLTPGAQAILDRIRKNLPYDPNAKTKVPGKGSGLLRLVPSGPKLRLEKVNRKK